MRPLNPLDLRFCVAELFDTLKLYSRRLPTATYSSSGVTLTALEIKAEYEYGDDWNDYAKHIINIYKKEM